MTPLAIQEQLNALKNTTDKAVKSKESARNFLVEAGISKNKTSVKSPASNNKTSSSKKN